MILFFFSSHDVTEFDPIANHLVHSSAKAALFENKHATRPNEFHALFDMKMSAFLNAKQFEPILLIKFSI